ALEGAAADGPPGAAAAAQGAAAAVAGAAAGGAQRLAGGGRAGAAGHVDGDGGAGGGQRGDADLDVGGRVGEGLAHAQRRVAEGGGAGDGVDQLGPAHGGVVGAAVDEHAVDHRRGGGEVVEPEGLAVLDVVKARAVDGDAQRLDAGGLLLDGHHGEGAVGGGGHHVGRLEPAQPPLLIGREVAEAAAHDVEGIAVLGERARAAHGDAHAVL